MGSVLYAPVPPPFHGVPAPHHHTRDRLIPHPRRQDSENDEINGDLSFSTTSKSKSPPYALVPRGSTARGPTPFCRYHEVLALARCRGVRVHNASRYMASSINVILLIYVDHKIGRRVLFIVNDISPQHRALFPPSAHTGILAQEKRALLEDLFEPGSVTLALLLLRRLIYWTTHMKLAWTTSRELPLDKSFEPSHSNLCHSAFKL